MLRNLSTELKVGLLILAGLGIIVYGSVVVTGWRPGQTDTYSVNLFFANASGLLVGSPVMVAGVKIGQVQEITLAENKAKVRASIFKRYTLHADATATIKSLGILGDKYIDVQPGSATQPPLHDGDTIVRVLPGTDLDSLVQNLSDILQDVRSVTASLRETLGGNNGRQRLDTILNQIEKATSDISRITDATNKQIDTILANLNHFTGNLNQITEDNRENLRQTIANFQSFSSGLDQMTKENREGLRETIANFQSVSGDIKQLVANNREALQNIIDNVNTFANALAKNGPPITDDLRQILSKNKRSLNDAVVSLDHSMDKLDKTMTHVQSISDKMDRGQGTIGKLINDETTVDQLNTALTGVNRFLTQANSIKLDLGGHVEYMVRQGQYKAYVDVRLQPLKDRYYLLQLVDNPRGDITTRTITDTVGSTTTTTNETVISDKLTLSLLIGQRYYDTVLKGGIMENKFGLGIDQYFGEDDNYRIGLDVWDFSNTNGPHVKLSGYWRFFSNAFMLVGADDIASKNHAYRDAFFGIGLHFNEDSLKPLMSSLPIGSLAKP